MKIKIISNISQRHANLNEIELTHANNVIDISLQLKSKHLIKNNDFLLSYKEDYITCFSKTNNNYSHIKIELDNHILSEEIADYQKYIKAVDYAKLHHKQQKYDSNLPYFYHLKQTDKVIDFFTMNLPPSKTLTLKTAAILHDIIEDTEISYDELMIEFGKEIADIVHKVTKTYDGSNIEFEEEYYKNMSDNELAVIVKIADKCANSKQTIKNKSRWHANRIISTHKLFQKYTYNKTNCIELKNYLNLLVEKTAQVLA